MMSVREREWKKLDEIDEEHRAVAERFRRLLEDLKMTQDQFATATGGLLERVEVNGAVNGKTLAKTSRWIQAVSNATGVTFEAADDYLRGRVDLFEMRRKSQAARSKPTRTPDPPAGTFLLKLGDIPGLKSWVQNNPSAVTLSELARGIEVIESSAATYAREKDGQPFDGWDAFFRDLRAGKLEPTQAADEAGMRMAREKEKQSLGGRTPGKFLQDARPKATGSNRKR